MDDDLTGLAGDRRKHPFVPGFTPEQSWALDILVERTAERAADRAIQKLIGQGCPFECPVKPVVFGKREAGIIGLDQKVDDLDKAIRNATRALWIAATALALTLVDILVRGVVHL